MALPPTIPTSFVPQSSGVTQRKYRADLSSAFAFFCYGVFMLVLILSVAVFVYQQILIGSEKAKWAELEKARSHINPETVQEFVHLRDRLLAAKNLLNSHVAPTGFFKDFNEEIPTNIRFTAARISAAEGGKYKLTGAGTAATFNALAAFSSGIAETGHIKDAIFSGITVTKDKGVSFALTATVDPAVLVFNPETDTSEASATTTTP